MNPTMSQPHKHLDHDEVERVVKDIRRKSSSVSAAFIQTVHEILLKALLKSKQYKKVLSGAIRRRSTMPNL